MTPMLGHIPGLTGDWAAQREFFASLSPVEARQYAAHRNAAAKAKPKAGVPDPPLLTGASGGDGTVTVTFNPPANDGGSEIVSYTATTCCSGQKASGANSPLTIAGLNNGQAYKVFVVATNANGDSHPSLQIGTATPDSPASARNQRSPQASAAIAESWARAFNRKIGAI